MTDDLHAAVRETKHREMPRICPACSEALMVTGLDCPTCNASIRGQFSPGPLARLSREQQHFLLVFMRNGGTIREVERELHISYPTVRSRLDQISRILSEVEDDRK